VQRHLFWNASREWQKLSNRDYSLSQYETVERLLRPKATGSANEFSDEKKLKVTLLSGQMQRIKYNHLRGQYPESFAQLASIDEELLIYADIRSKLNHLKAMTDGVLDKELIWLGTILNWLKKNYSSSHQGLVEKLFVEHARRRFSLEEQYPAIVKSYKRFSREESSIISGDFMLVAVNLDLHEAMFSDNHIDKFISNLANEPRYYGLWKPKSSSVISIIELSFELYRKAVKVIPFSDPYSYLNELGSINERARNNNIKEDLAIIFDLGVLTEVIAK